MLFSCSVVSKSLWPHGLQHPRHPCPSPSPGICLNSCPLRPWCHPTSSSSIVPFSSFNELTFHLRVFSNELTHCIRWQSIGALASASVHQNIQGWFPLGLTGLISLLSKGLSRVFSSTTVQKHQFFGTWPFLLSSCYIHKWLLEKNHSFDYKDFCRLSNVSLF